jgi:hypothetical protein
MYKDVDGRTVDGNGKPLGEPPSITKEVSDVSTIVMRRARLSDVIGNAELGVVDLIEWGGMGLKSVRFQKESDGTFMWVATLKDGWGVRFPMKSSQYVKTFKTLANAKRSFLRQYGRDCYWRA